MFISEHFKRQNKYYELCGELNNLMISLQQMNDVMVSNHETFNWPSSKPTFSHVLYNCDSQTQLNHLKMALSFRWGVFADVVCVWLLLPVLVPLKRKR